MFATRTAKTHDLTQYTESQQSPTREQATINNRHLPFHTKSQSPFPTIFIIDTRRKKDGFPNYTHHCSESWENTTQTEVASAPHLSCHFHDRNQTDYHNRIRLPILVHWYEYLQSKRECRIVLTRHWRNCIIDQHLLQGVDKYGNIWVKEDTPEGPMAVISESLYCQVDRVLITGGNITPSYLKGPTQSKWLELVAGQSGAALLPAYVKQKRCWH